MKLSTRRARRSRVSGLLLVAALALTALVLAACGDDDGDAGGGLSDFERGPNVPIVIPAGQPIVIGVSTVLTGPISERGEEYRDAVISGVEAWKQANGDEIAGHEIVVRAEDDG